MAEAVMEKLSRVLSARGRSQVSEGNFALPGRRYPIHDASHARNALARVSQYGSRAERAAVRAAVSRRYPGIGKTAGAASKALRERAARPIKQLLGPTKSLASNLTVPTQPQKEKVAMPSLKSILAAATTGTGGLALGGAGGYLAGHRTGMARDAETPYGNAQMRFAYNKGRGLGRQEVVNTLRQRMAMAQRGKTKKASSNAIVAAEWVLENRRSVHPALVIPDSVKGY